MALMHRRTFAKAAMAASIIGQAGADRLPLHAAEAAPTLDGDFPGGCCLFGGMRDGALTGRPRTPAKVSGGLWFWFTARLSGARGPQKIELHWPADNAELKARSEYGGNKNFATVLDRVINTSGVHPLAVREQSGRPGLRERIRPGLQ